MYRRGDEWYRGIDLLELNLEALHETLSYDDRRFALVPAGGCQPQIVVSRRLGGLFGEQYANAGRDQMLVAIVTEDDDPYDPAYWPFEKIPEGDALIGIVGETGCRWESLHGTGDRRVDTNPVVQGITELVQGISSDYYPLDQITVGQDLACGSALTNGIRFGARSYEADVWVGALVISPGGPDYANDYRAEDDQVIVRWNHRKLINVYFDPSLSSADRSTYHVLRSAGMPADEAREAARMVAA